MADAGVGETAAAEGAKSAGEAATAAGTADAAAGAAGANSIFAGTDALAAAGAGAGAEGAAGLGTLGAAAGGDLAAIAPSGITALGPSAAGEALSPIAAGDAVGSGLGTLGSAAGDLSAIAPSGITAFSDAGTAAGEALSPIGASGDIASGGLSTAPTTSSGFGGVGVDQGINTPGVANGAGGISGTVSKALDALGSGALKYGPLINSTIALARQGSGSYQKQLNAAAGPAQAVSNQLLAQFQNGQLNGSDQYQIAQWSEQQKSQINQYYQNAGLGNSSMHQAALQQVDAQAEAMRQQAVQNLLKSGLSAAGVSSPLITAGVNAAMKEDQNAQNAMSNFISTLAKMNTPTPTPTGTPG